MSNYSLQESNYIINRSLIRSYYDSLRLHKTTSFGMKFFAWLSIIDAAILLALGISRLIKG